MISQGCRRHQAILFADVHALGTALSTLTTTSRGGGFVDTDSTPALQAVSKRVLALDQRTSRGDA